MKKEGFLVILLVIGIFLRVLTIDRPFWGDEVDFVYPAKTLVESGRSQTIYGSDYNFHPPIGIAIYSAFYALFRNDLAFKITPIIFGMLTIAMTYLLAQLLYNKKTAMFAVFFLVFSKYFITANRRVDVDGGILSFFLVAAFYFFAKYLDTRKYKNFIAASIFVGLAGTTKVTGFFPLFVFPLYMWIDKKAVFAKEFFISALIASSIFTLGIIIFSNYSDNYLLGIITHLIGYGSSGLLNFINDKAAAVFVILWEFSPFVLLSSGLLWLKKEDRLLSFALLLGGIISMLPSGGDKVRYISTLLPFFFILVSKLWVEYLSNEKMLFTFSITALSFVFLYAINPFHNMWYFEFIWKTLAVVALPWASLLFFRNKKRFLSIVIIIGLSYNLFFILHEIDYLSINSNAVKESIDFLKTLDGKLLLTKDLKINFDGASLLEYELTDEMIQAHDYVGICRVFHYPNEILLKLGATAKNVKDIKINNATWCKIYELK